MDYNYVLPWAVSNIVALSLIFISLRRPLIARIAFGIIFFVAVLVNLLTAWNWPVLYQAYAETAIPPYQSFISGFFARHTEMLVTLIAFGQLLIGLGLIIGRSLLLPACVGAILFFLAIAPLGIGSAFPAPLIMSIAILILYYRSVQT